MVGFLRLRGEVTGWKAGVGCASNYCEVILCWTIVGGGE